MAIFKQNVDLGGSEMREIVLCQLFECADHCLAIALLNSLTVSGILVGAAERIDNEIDRGLKHTDRGTRKDIGEAVVNSLKSEIGIYFGSDNREPDRCCEDKKISDIQELHLQNVLVDSVSQLVSEDSADLVGGH